MAHKAWAGASHGVGHAGQAQVVEAVAPQEPLGGAPAAALPGDHGRGLVGPDVVRVPGRADTNTLVRAFLFTDPTRTKWEFPISKIIPLLL